MRLLRKIQETTLVIREAEGKTRYQRRLEAKEKRIKVLPYQRKSVHKSGSKVFIDNKVVKDDHYGGRFV